MDHAQRKQDHLEICLNQDTSSCLSTGLERIRLCHNALPEIDLDDVDTRAVFLGHRLRAPFLISSMTGGTSEARRINRNLAIAAQARGVTLALGSARVVLADADTLPSFDVRRYAPDVPLFANLGAVQLVKGVTPADCGWLVTQLGADGLILHLNPLQEALQAGGDTQFGGILAHVADLCQQAEYPVIVKEVGWGLSRPVAEALASVGVSALDVAGVGGTSWSEVERQRSFGEPLAEIAAPFRSWGLSTVESLRAVRAACPALPVIASGGLANGVDAAKAMALGANLCGFAGALLAAANDSAEAVAAQIEIMEAQLRIAMFAVVAADLGQLNASKLMHETVERS